MKEDEIDYVMSYRANKVQKKFYSKYFAYGSANLALVCM